MRTYTVHVHIEDAETVGSQESAARKLDKTFEITGTDADDIREKVKTLLVQKNLPPIRSLNFHDEKVIVFCGEHPDRLGANLVPEVTPRWRRPPGPKRL